MNREVREGAGGAQPRRASIIPRMGKMKESAPLQSDGGMAQSLDGMEGEEPNTQRGGAKPLPLETHDLTLTTTIEYRDGLIEYIASLRNDGGRPVEEVSVLPSVPPETFRAEPAHAVIGPLAAGQTGSATFLLEPLAEFEALVLARPVIEGRDVEVRSSVRSRKGSITCEVELLNRQGIRLRGLDVSPLLPEGFLSTVPSKRVDLGPRERARLVFNVLPRAEFAVAERRGKRAAFSPRGVAVREPAPSDLERNMPAELRPLPPYSRVKVHKPGLKVESKAMRGLMARSEVREVLRAEEVVPEEIEIRMVKGVKASVRKPPARAASSQQESAPSEQQEPVSRRERRPVTRAKPADAEPEVEQFEETFRDEIRRGREIAAEGDEEKAEDEGFDGAETTTGGESESDETVDEPAEDATEDEPATAVDPEHPPCPDCGNGLDWVQEYDRWYCYSCEKYPW